ncbi:hypothetical protein CPB86DRAFT_791062 [Serendipita vermifera]|nr:hypothetical protein CPB86DRAFT_791062 [Serendipita vermifera]
MPQRLPAKKSTYPEDDIMEAKIGDNLHKVRVLRAEKHQIRAELVELVALAKRMALDSVREAEKEVTLVAQEEVAFQEVVRGYRGTLPKLQVYEAPILAMAGSVGLTEQAGTPPSSKSSSLESTQPDSSTFIVSPQHNIESTLEETTELSYAEHRREKEDQMLRELGNLKQIIGGWAHLCSIYNQRNQQNSQDHDVLTQDSHVEKPRSRKNLDWAKGSGITPEKEARMERIETMNRCQRKSKLDYEQAKDTAIHMATVEMPQIEAEAQELARGEREEMRRSKHQQREKRRRRGADNRLSVLVSHALQIGESPRRQRPRKEHPNPQRR